MKILHVITGLNTGGAETMLYRLLSTASNKIGEHRVVCLGKSGRVGEKIGAKGIHVDVLGGKSRLSAPRVIQAATSIAKKYQPDIVQGWMYDGNLAGWWLAKRCNAKLLWNVRHSVVDLSWEPFDLQFVIRLGAYLSRKADAIIYNSHIAAVQHEVLGFSAEKKRVLPNGFDTTVYKPDEDARTRIRTELGIAEDAFLVGKIARYHPMKDHLNFLKAAGEVSGSVANTYFLLAGSGTGNDNKKLLDAAEQAGIRPRTFFLGERQDTTALNAALDIAVSSSAWGEGFSNVIGEAMSCGVPCVVTDVGDAKQLLGETGIIVPTKDYVALSEAIQRLLKNNELRISFGKEARSRIKKFYSLDNIVNEYERLWKGL